MACGCGRSGGGSYRSRPVTRLGGNRLIQGGTTPTQIANTAMTPQSPRNAGGMNSEQRKTQVLRRDAIRKALNK